MVKYVQGVPLWRSPWGFAPTPHNGLIQPTAEVIP